MIDTKFVGPGRITLNGYCFAAYNSTITRFKEGWEVRLDFAYWLYQQFPFVVSGLAVADVVPAIQAELERLAITEEVNGPEITRWLEDQEHRVQESVERMKREMSR